MDMDNGTGLRDEVISVKSLEEDEILKNFQPQKGRKEDLLSTLCTVTPTMTGTTRTMTWNPR